MNNKKIKSIWIFNHYAINSFYNKGGRHYWIAKELMKKGYDVTIFCSNIRDFTGDFVELNNKKFEEKKIDSIKYVFIKTRNRKKGMISRLLNIITFYINLKKVINKNISYLSTPDLIIGSSVHPLTLVAGIKIGKKYNVPVICEVRDLWPEAIFAYNKAKEKSILGKILIKGEYWIYKNADAIIFTKEGDIDYIKEKKWDIKSGGDIDLEKCFYINNGLDIQEFLSSIKENTLQDPDLDEKLFKVTYIGTIRPLNNVDKLIETAKLIQCDKNIVFIIYGDGNQVDNIRELVNQHNLLNVKLKGHIEKKFIPYILSRSSVNILSYSQTKYNWSRGNSSNKLFEYMASGKPIISTIKMGYSPFEKYNIGIELENASPQELAEAIINIKKLTKSEYDKLSNNAFKAAQDFDFTLLTTKLIDVIEDLTKEQVQKIRR